MQQKPRARPSLSFWAVMRQLNTPLTLYLTDGDVFHRLVLVGKELRFWKNLGAKEALYWMTQDLAAVRFGLGCFAQL